MKKKKQVIYEIVNKVNGKKYIGSAVNFIRRKRVHLNLLNKGKHHSIYLQNSFNKYGEENFEFNVLEEVEDVNLLINVEQKWLDKEQPELNILLIADSHLGIKRSEETKKKISETLTGRKLSEEHVEAMRKGLIGHKQSEETKKKRVESCKNSETFQKVVRSKERNEKIKKTRLKNGGYVVTDKMKKQISETLKSKNLQSATSLEVEKYDLEGNLLETYPSLRKAELGNGIAKGYLSKRLKEGINKIKGYIWNLKKK